MLISEEYRSEQEQLHAKHHEYGSASVNYAPLVSKLINKSQASKILDYGAGKGRLAKNLVLDHPASVHHYDPAIPEYAKAPEPCDFVTCIDVLEHIEPEHLADVLDHLKELTTGIGFFTIHTGPAVKVLSDGRNAHLTQEPMDWWLPKLMQRFSLQSLSVVNNGFWVVVQTKDSH